MLTAEPRADWLGSLKKLDFVVLRRSAAWASAAFIAVVTVIFAADSETGSRRIQQALTDAPEAARATAVVAQIPAGQPELERLAGRLNETVKQLTAERERLNDRIASLERNFEDVTGSIRKAPDATPTLTPITPAAVPPMTIFTAVPPLPSDSPAVWPAPRPAASAKPEMTGPDTVPPAMSRPETVKPDIVKSETTDEPTRPVVRIETPGIPLPPVRAGHDATGSVTQTGNTHENATQSSPQASAEARGANDILGVDLGGARSIDALAIHWSALKVKFGEQLNNLQPVVSIRERKPGVPELRLIAGPIAGVEAATKLCMTLVTARAPCRPTQFAGQRLVQR